MQSLSEPRRPAAASAGSEVEGANAAPRRQLLVEVYSPQPLRQAVPVQGKRHGVCGRTVRALPARLVRPMAAVLVVAGHAVALSGIFLLTQTHQSPPAPAAPLEVFNVARPPLITLAELASNIPPPEPQKPETVAVRIPSLALPAGATEIAITIAGSAAVVIGEANPAEVAYVVRSCSAARLAGSAARPRVPDITLLVHVEKDGRVTDSRVEVGSGMNRIDNSARACLHEHGLLTPQRVHGVSVASWQRVHWSAS
jgi:hypothetical protein